MAGMKTLVAQRFWGKVAVAGPGDCWEWQASRSKQGYGQFYPVGRTRSYAHRYSYELANGPIPEGLVVRHVCDNTACVNPAHLRAGTQKENVGDFIATGRHYNTRKESCPQGHPYDDENTYTTRRGRTCRICKREAQRRWKRGRRGGKF